MVPLSVFSEFSQQVVSSNLFLVRSLYTDMDKTDSTHLFTVNSFHLIGIFE